MKRVFIIHGWEGAPQHGWYPWLKAELEKKGFQVFVPLMPSPDAPEIKSWISHLKNIVGEPDKDTYFVGHSMGCQTILRYFEGLPKNTKVGGAVFVAGFFKVFPDAAPDEKSKAIAKPWLETPIDFEKVLQTLAERSSAGPRKPKRFSRETKNMIALFSDNDPYVPCEENKKIFEKFCKKTIVEKNKGHIAGMDGVRELPSALNAVLELAKV